MRDYGQIITKMQDTPWLITEGALRTILQIANEHISGNVSLEEIRQRTEGAKRTRSSVVRQEGAVGLLPLHGPIFPKANMMTELSGATSIEQWQQDFRALMANDRVTSILLDIDSPGGSSAMVREMADEIREGRKTKPIYAVANTMAGSAAYMLASQASELYVSDSGYVGSVGTYIVHTDASKLNEKIGVTETVIHEGRFKAALIQPLTEETRAHIQEIVADCQDSFVEAVALGRNTTVEDVSENYGEGGVVSAKRALEAKMVDGINTFDEVLGSLLDGGGTLVTVGSGGESSGFSLRASYDKEKEHSEPGSGLGGEPAPRPDPEDEHKDDWKANGGRLQRPPNIPELEEMAMNREQLLQYAAKLGIDGADGLTDEALATKVSEGLDAQFDLVGELQSATEQAAQKVEFAKQFPEQAEELHKLKEKAQVTDANAFAQIVSGFITTEGEGAEAKETKFRLSSLAQEVVRDSHLKLAQGNFVPDDLKTLVETCATSGVQQGEEGSSRIDESEPVVIGRDRKTVRTQFTTKVTELMTNDNMGRKEAIAEAGKRYPELAEAYRAS